MLTIRIYTTDSWLSMILESDYMLFFRRFVRQFAYLHVIRYRAESWKLVFIGYSQSYTHYPQVGCP